MVKRWYVLILLTAVYALNIADRFVMSILIEPIKADLQLSDTAVGFLTGVALAIFYVVAGLPIATLADRSNRRNIVSVSLAFWSAFTALCAFTQNYWQLLLARIGVGVGEAGGTAPSQALLADLFPWRERGLAMAIYGLGVAIGSGIAGLGGYISDAWGWRTVFLIFGIPGVLFALVVWKTVPEPPRGQADHDAHTEKAGLFDTIRYALSVPALRHMMAGSILFPLWAWGLMWWTPAFLSRSFGMSTGDAGGVLALIHIVGGTFVLIAAAFIMNWLKNKPANWASTYAAITMLLGSIPSIIAFSSDNQSVTLTMLWLFIPITYASFGATFSLIQNLSPAPMRSQMTAIMLFLTNFANLVLAPQLIGLASDFMAPKYGDESLRHALIPLAWVGLWGAYHYWAIGKNLTDGMTRAGNNPEARANT